MARWLDRFFYDRDDYNLLAEVDALKAADAAGKKKYLRRLLDPYLHPRGIKELAAPRAIRLVYAMSRLLAPGRSPEVIEQRLAALAALRREVIEGSASPLPRNAARVLLQSLKDLVRSDGPLIERLSLAHDVIQALVGHPRFIRRRLRRYHLLEMPEVWNQAAFDHHVYDAGTKGRKNPTHLILDAWIKGIRQLQVVYYDRVPSAIARELVEAADIMDVDVRIGMDFPAVTADGKAVSLVWEPRGFASSDQFLAFLDQEPVKAFFGDYSDMSAWRRREVLARLEHFNQRERQELDVHLGVPCPPLSEESFLRMVGDGQPSLLHLAEFIHAAYLDARRVAASAPNRNGAAWEDWSPEWLLDRWRGDGFTPEGESPPAMRRSPAELARALAALPSGCRICLSLTGLALADVAEILADADGAITHLELFNLITYKTGRAPDLPAINEFRQALNHGDVIRIKHILKITLEKLESECGNAEDAAQERLATRVKRFQALLNQLPRLAKLYARAPLGARIGSHSTGRYRRLYGMGLAAIASLPRAAQRHVRAGNDPFREIVPVRARLVREISYEAAEPAPTFWSALDYPLGLGLATTSTWVVADTVNRLEPPGNLVTLGGDYHPFASSRPSGFVEGWITLNSRLKMALKVAAGFLPAMLTFLFTQPAGLLAYGGAALWLGITAVRNVLQSMAAGGGWRRSDLLRWNRFVSWQRVADSLMYTGWSVPLLELGVRYGLLERGMGFTSANASIVVYAVLAMVNGVYIASHNWLRGFPRAAIVGNLFRSALSIPLALAVGSGVVWLLTGLGVAGAAAMVAAWSAVIAKLSSDLVAGLIEGYADRARHIRLRTDDYHVKFRQLFAHYSRLEMLFPSEDLLERLKSPKEFIQSVSREGGTLARILIINALDLMYFRFYQPQAPIAWRRAVERLTAEERLILLRSQSVLEKEKEVSRLFLDGLLGKHFAPALSFYLEHHHTYLADCRTGRDGEGNEL